MAFGLIHWILLLYSPYLPQPTSLRCKVCKGRQTFFVVLFVNFLRKCTVICVSWRRTLHSSRMTRPIEPLIISSTLWLIHPWYIPQIIQRTFSCIVSTYSTTIGMVLAQEDPNGQEHVIYYASKNFIDYETRYSRVEKLALATVTTVQNFCH